MGPLSASDRGGKPVLHGSARGVQEPAHLRPDLSDLAPGRGPSRPPQGPSPVRPEPAHEQLWQSQQTAARMGTSLWASKGHFI